MQLIRFFVSPEHNYFGHHGKPPGEHDVLEPDQIECVTGRGIRGDRFFDHAENYKGQITFFASEVYEELKQKFGVEDQAASAFRRNVMTSGVDLNDLIGTEFDIQGVRFAGVEECTPCYWMDRAFHPGTHEMLKGRGGLRARILSDGSLSLNASN
jgi:MOSC domain-containing protein YiiM